MITKSDLYKRINKNLGITIQWQEFEEILQELGIQKRDSLQVEKVIKGKTQKLWAYLYSEQDEQKIYRYIIEKMIKEKRLVSKRELEEKYGLTVHQMRYLLDRNNIFKLLYISKGEKHNYIHRKDVSKIEKLVKQRQKKKDNIEKRKNNIVQYKFTDTDNEYREEVKDRTIDRLRAHIESQKERIVELENRIILLRTELENEKNKSWIRKLFRR